jgi:hypothetical protein
MTKSPLSETDGSAPCSRASSQVVPIRECYKDGPNTMKDVCNRDGLPGTAPGSFGRVPPPHRLTEVDQPPARGQIRSWYGCRLGTQRRETQVSVVHVLSSSCKPLHGEQARLWSRAVQDLRLDLDPYTCKASYVCGMLRQFIEAAGLQLSQEYHVGALMSAASAAELVGWCYKGSDSSDQAGKRLGDGVHFLQEVGPPYHGSVYHPAADIAAWVRNVRNFGAHGAAHGKQLTLDRVLTVWLLRSLARALDVFWANEGDVSRHQRFARAAITPLYTEGEPIFVRDVQGRLADGLMPSAQLAHEANWRPAQLWEKPQPIGVVGRIFNNSPPVTGTP